MIRYRCVQRIGITLFGLIAGGCRQNLLGTPNAVGQITFGTLESPASARAGFLAAMVSFNNVVVGSGNPISVFIDGGQLADELAVQASGRADLGALDGRHTVYSEAFNGQPIHSEIGDGSVQALVQARSQLLLVVGPLVAYEQSSGRQSLAGEAYALVGYAELYIAEDYCPGITLDRALPGSGIAFGTSLTTDSLLGTAIGHFDSALAYAYNNDTVINLASVGLGRAWLDRGRLESAAQAVAHVPPTFVYDLTSAAVGNSGTLVPNIWARQTSRAYLSYGQCAANWNVADRDGGVGVDYISAADFRLVLDSSLVTCDSYAYGPHGRFGHYGLTDSIFYYPLKFGPVGQSVSIPIATGVEAALITAEAAAGNNVATPGAMLTQLQTLRNSAAQTYLQYTGAIPVMSPESLAVTDPAEALSILFRERAFWLFGMGTRLGDMRRELRQYGGMLGANAANLIYPNGPYGPEQISQAFDQALNPFPWQTYGSDIDMPLPTAASTGSTTFLNPQYTGCTTPTTQP